MTIYFDASNIISTKKSKKIILINKYIIYNKVDKGKTEAIRRRKTRGSLDEDSQLPENEKFYGVGFFI